MYNNLTGQKIGGNSHDVGVSYALAEPAERQRMQTRAIHIADVVDAMEQGFRAEPDVPMSVLAMLSDEALAMLFEQSEEWRGKSRERELEQQIDQMRAAEATIGGYYVDLREIVGAMHVPADFRSIDGKPGHIAWTEQKARELVKQAARADAYAADARKAEARTELLERYVNACDSKRIPYNWNIFKMSTTALRRHVETFEHMDRLGRCDCNPERVAWFETRTQQETEQSLRWHMQRSEETRKLIDSLVRERLSESVADQLMDALMGRKADDDKGEWVTWGKMEKGRRPPLLNDDDMVEIETAGGGRNVLAAGVTAWEQVERFRRVK